MIKANSSKEGSGEQSCRLAASDCGIKAEQGQGCAACGEPTSAGHNNKFLRCLTSDVHGLSLPELSHEEESALQRNLFCDMTGVSPRGWDACAGRDGFSLNRQTGIFTAKASIYVDLFPILRILHNDTMTLTSRSLGVCLLVSLIAVAHPLLGQSSSPPQRTERPAPPTRDPNTPGYVTAKQLPDGSNPPANVDGNFIVGPTHEPPPETVRQRRHSQRHRNRVHHELLRQQDLSRHRPRRQHLRHSRSRGPRKASRNAPAIPHPTPARWPSMFPSSTFAGTVAPFIVGADGPDTLALLRARHSDRTTQGSGDDRHFHRQRQRRRAGK